MKWIGNRQSDNVDDRRGMSAGGKVALGGGGLAIVFFVLKMFMGSDNAQLLDTIESQMQQNQTQTQATGQQELTPEQKEMGDFAKTVLAYTEDTWGQIFQENGMQYQ